MSIHYLNPEDAPRVCPTCDSTGVYTGVRYGNQPCPGCNGTGQLGNPEGARVAIVDRRKREGVGPSRYYALGYNARYWDTPVGPFPTESAALEAARKAHREGAK